LSVTTNCVEEVSVPAITETVAEPRFCLPLVSTIVPFTVPFTFTGAVTCEKECVAKNKIPKMRSKPFFFIGRFIISAKIVLTDR
jgi:hypothetical protein